MKYIVILSSSIFLLLLLFSCDSMRYVPQKERGAKKAIQKEVRKINVKQNRVKAILMAYPTLADTTTTITTIDVVSEVRIDTVEIVIEDKTKIDSLINVVDDLLTSLLEAPDTVIEEQIKWLVRRIREEAAPKDTLIYFTITRDVKIGESIISMYTEVTFGIKDGKLYHSHKVVPVDSKAIIELQIVTFDVRRLPKLVQLGLGAVGIFLLIIAGVFLYRVMAPIIKKVT